MERIAFEIMGVLTEIVVHGVRKNGIFRMGFNSAMGKTKLASCIAEYKTYMPDLKAESYDLSSYTRGMKISDLIGCGLKLVIIDDYDSYNGEMADDIIELSKECIVLIDSKVDPKIRADIFSRAIEMEDGTIHVY